MKLRYLFSMIVASVLLFASCAPEAPTTSFDNIKLDKTFVVIPEEGGSVELTVNATEAWAFDTLYTEDTWPNVITRKKDDNGNYQVSKVEASWLSVDKMSSEAGEVVVTFTAEAVSGGRELELCIKAGLNSQFVKVRQGSLESVSATCKEVIDGPDGKTYKTKGVVTSIVNTEYGNWYLNDGTGEVYVYGTLDKDGKTKNFKSLGLEVGDVVEVEGPKLTYGSTVELVDVMVLSIEKSLVKVLTESQVYPKEGGEFEVKLAYKGDEVLPTVGEECRDWASVVAMKKVAGVATKIEPNPADTCVVTLNVLPNTGGTRDGSVSFSTKSGKNSSEVAFDFQQEGSIVDATVADFLAQPVGPALFKLTGRVSGLKTGDYGNFHLVDATGSVYVYGLTATPVEKNDKSFPTLGVKEGDIVTIVGKRDQYPNAKVENEKEQVGGPAYYVSHVSAKVATVEQFKAAAEDDTRYMLTGVVSDIAMDKKDPTKVNAYGNFNITDETGTVYVYGLTYAPVASNDKSFEKLGLKNGDKVTLVGTRTSYNGAIQVGGPAYYVSHEAGAPAVDPWEAAAKYTNGAEATADALMKEIRAYADATNLYVRVTATAALDGADYLDVEFCDGNGANSVWWGWTTTGTNTYWKEHKGTVDANGNLTAMQFSHNGEYKDIVVKSEKAGSDMVWTLTYPRAYVDTYKANGKTYIAAILWKGWDGYWAVPARTNAMLEVTLP